VQEYSFEVRLVAVVNVRAEDERTAQQVVISSALGSPGVSEINLANSSALVSGKVAKIIDIEFYVEEDSVKRRGRLL
jgi:hypothetical protein